jgi:hypothetical protein
MPNLFEPSVKQGIMERLSKLGPQATRQWGKMDAAQMLCHCSTAMEAGTGDKPLRQRFIGKLFARFVKKSLVRGEKPFSRNSPTDPTFVMTDAKDFAREKDYLTNLINRFCAAGPEHAGKHTHSFFGRVTGDDWGVIMYKHLDHHLRQFGC